MPGKQPGGCASQAKNGRVVCQPLLLPSTHLHTPPPRPLLQPAFLPACLHVCCCCRLLPPTATTAAANGYAHLPIHHHDYCLPTCFPTHCHCCCCAGWGHSGALRQAVGLQLGAGKGKLGLGPLLGGLTPKDPPHRCAYASPYNVCGS